MEGWSEVPNDPVVVKEKGPWSMVSGNPLRQSRDHSCCLVVLIPTLPPIDVVKSKKVQKKTNLLDATFCVRILLLVQERSSSCTSELIATVSVWRDRGPEESNPLKSRSTSRTLPPSSSRSCSSAMSCCFVPASWPRWCSWLEEAPFEKPQELSLMWEVP